MWGRLTLGFGRPPCGAPGWHLGPRCPPTALCYENLSARPNFVLKDVQNYFSKHFHARNFFWIFVKDRKSARKVSSMQGCFENSNMQWEKSKKSRKAKWWKSKYEIRTDLPSARAHRLESDERDLSPALITIVRFVLENWTRMSLRPYATPSLHVFFLIVWS